MARVLPSKPPKALTISAWPRARKDAVAAAQVHELVGDQEACQV